MSEVIVVGIAGGTGSGKTTFAQGVAKRLGGNVTIIAHDNYYRSHSNMSLDERALLNYDHPDAYETELLVQQLTELRAGKAVQMPQYDFSVHDRMEQTVTVEPTRVIIVEGILVLADERLRDLMDIRIFVDAPADVRILRRLARDVEERGRSVQSVIDQYLATVKPMHDAYVEPTRHHAHVVVPSTQDNSLAQELVAGMIQTLMETGR